MENKFMRVLVLVCGLLSGSVAHAQIPTTDVASLIQRITMIASDAKQLAELVEQVRQATKTAKSLEDTLGSALNADQLQELQAILNAAQSANNAALRQLDVIYEKDPRTGRPDYDTYMNATKEEIRKAIGNNEAILSEISSSAARINSLVDQSNAAEGALAAQQAGNQINAELAAQVQKLRQQQARQAQADSAAALAATEQRQQDTNDSQKMTNMFYFGR